MSDRLSINLVAFLAEHRACGEIDTGIFDGEPPRVWVTCSSGARVEARAEEDHA